MTMNRRVSPNQLASGNPSAGANNLAPGDRGRSHSDQRQASPGTGRINTNVLPPMGLQSKAQAASVNAHPHLFASAYQTQTQPTFGCLPLPQQAKEPTVRFNLAQAFVWQIRFILGNITQKKHLQSATVELQQLSDRFGNDFDRYLFRELVEQIDLREPNKAGRDKTEQLKIQLFLQELMRSSQKVTFLQYWTDIAEQVFGETRLVDFHMELSKRLKLSLKLQLLVALALTDNNNEPASPVYLDCLNLFKTKLIEYGAQGKMEQLEEYVVHKAAYVVRVTPEYQKEDSLQEALRAIIDNNQAKQHQSVALRLTMNDDWLSSNPSPDDPANSLTKAGSGFEHLEHISAIMEPWELLLDLGHFSSNLFANINMALADFKDINEQQMAKTILMLALHHSGEKDLESEIACLVFEANKKADAGVFRREPEKKRSFSTWNVDNFSRAFRENYSNLQWQKVFEEFSRLTPESFASHLQPGQMDQKAYETVFQLYVKSKPQNLPMPMNYLLQRRWAMPSIQVVFIEHAITAYITRKDRNISFGKQCKRNFAQSSADIHVNEKVTAEMYDVWMCNDLIEILIELSESTQSRTVRRIFDTPLQQCPELLILTLARIKPPVGNVLLDELLSVLFPMFLGNNANSIPMIKKLWETNKAMVIRAFCELCRHEQRIINLSRVLDLTQEIKDSLIEIVYCEDYDFAVNLGILAGKRDFLHYDQWLKERIRGVGTPFIKSLVHYVNEQIMLPCREHLVHANITSQQLANFAGVQPVNGPPNPSLSQSEQAKIQEFEKQREMILERSHLNKEKLCITIEHLENPSNLGAVQQENSAQSAEPPKKISKTAQDMIKDLVLRYAIFFPKANQPAQNTDEEIDRAANEYFQNIFQSPAAEVDTRIDHLIKEMKRFKKSQIVKEQEIYACMLHGLFDEYRFLHKYPPQYLEKIAKLFGAVIKNRLLDPVLQDIAFKFVSDAFRREGKRQNFGIIIIRDIKHQLKDYPKFFQDINNYKDKIRQKDGVLFAEISRLYLEHQESLAQGGNETAQSSTGNLSDRISPRTITGSIGEMNLSVDGEEASGDFEEQKSEMAKKKTKEGKQADQQNYQQKAAGAATDSKATSLYSPAVFQKSSKTEAPQEEKFQLKSQEFVPTPSNIVEFQPQAQPAAGKTKQEEHVSSLTVGSQPFRKGNSPSEPLDVSTEATAQISRVRPQPQQPHTTQASHSPRHNSSSHRPPSLNAQPFKPTPSSVSPHHESEYHEFIKPVQQPQPLPKKPSDLQQQVFDESEIEEQQEWQRAIESKIQSAIRAKAKLRLEDLLQETFDKKQPQPSNEIQEQIRFTVNQTGRNNFEQKLQEIKGHVNDKKVQAVQEEEDEPDKELEPGKEKAPAAKVLTQGDVNTHWMINYILLKRISNQSQSFMGMYVDMIYQMGDKSFCVALTVKQAVGIFRRFLHIDEEQYAKVAARVSTTMPGTSLLKPYLQALGHFIGQLTLARNRPLLAKELDLKHLLLVGFRDNQNRRLIVTFVCRILKEASNSMVFKKLTNPWMKGLLEIMHEIFRLSQDPQHMLIGGDEIKLEIEMLFKALQVSELRQISLSGALHAVQTQQFKSMAQEIELSFLFTKAQILQPHLLRSDKNLPVEAKVEETQQEVTPAPKGPRVNFVVKEETAKKLSQKLGLKEEHISKAVHDAVDKSIHEILTPVVERSVTIALITTRELILKDFAYDSDETKISAASTHIVQNLAGSLALVTCREPLRMQLTNHIKKELKLACQQHSQVPAKEVAEMFAGTATEKQLTSAPRSQEEQLMEVVQSCSKENLELGCNLIKSAVIEKALVIVRQDKAINEALEKRIRARQTGQQNYRDETVSLPRDDLPQLLKPNLNGLTDSQYKVYLDFAKLGDRNKNDSVFQIQQKEQEEAKPVQQLAVYDSSLEGIISKIESERALTAVTRALLTHKLLKLVQNAKFVTGLKNNPQKITSQQQKIDQAQIEKKFSQERNKLWNYIEETLVKVCQRYDQNMAEDEFQLIKCQLSILGFIIKKYDVEDLKKKILTEVFLRMESLYILNVQLTMLLMQNGIFAVAEWDKHLAIFMHDSSGLLQENEVRFLAQFIETSIVKEKFLTPERMPNLLQVMEELEKSTSNDVQKMISETLQVVHTLCPTVLQQSLKTYFLKWVDLLNIEDVDAQEKEVNNYFTQLGAKVSQNQDMLFTFCNVMIKTSIEYTLYTQKGEKRLHNSTLDYRFIDSFIKLVVVLIDSFPNFSKQDFMAKIFHFIKLKLAEDHDSQLLHFNQKPFYRMLMSILTAVNMSEAFDYHTRKAILFDMAELLLEMNPNKYPAFAFAWLELISHRYFMPHFIKTTPATFNNEFQEEAESKYIQEQQQVQKWAKIKELLVSCFSFIKQNMVPGQSCSQALQQFYQATLRIVMVILKDYPLFLCEFHVNFVNSLPEHAIQLKNMILAAHPPNMQIPYPHSKDLKIDTISDVRSPRIQSTFDERFFKPVKLAKKPDGTFYQVSAQSGGATSIQQDLEEYFRTRRPNLVSTICEKLMTTTEKVYEKETPCNAVIHATVLYIVMQALGDPQLAAINGQRERPQDSSDFGQAEYFDLIKRMVIELDDSTRLSFLNCIVNELRYPNSHTYQFCQILLRLFKETKEMNPLIQEQISKILFERLHVHRPFPWGLMINFRELIQNTKYGFQRAAFLTQHSQAVSHMFQKGQLYQFAKYIPKNFLTTLAQQSPTGIQKSLEKQE